MLDGSALPKEGFLRLRQIIGRNAVTEQQARKNRARGKGPRRPREAIAPLIPVSASTWWGWIRKGRAPKPTKIGGVTVWKAAQIRSLIK